MNNPNPQALVIAQLNDSFRRKMNTGVVVVTLGIQALPELDQRQILTKVSSYNQFNADNDPYGEHDFGSFVHNGQKIFWKIDYYDLEMRVHSEDPEDPAMTRRLLTIMLAEEY